MNSREIFKLSFADLNKLVQNWESYMRFNSLLFDQSFGKWSYINRLHNFKKCWYYYSC